MKGRGTEGRCCHSDSSIRQRGISLVIVMILLVSLSILAVGSTQDTGLQFKMVRNDQLYTSAYLAAYSEINAQLDVINTNDDDEIDPAIVNLVQLKAGDSIPLEPDSLAGPHQGDSAFDQTVEFVLSCTPDRCPTPPGFTISQMTSVLRARINSRTDMEGSGAASDQSQSFWYLVPQTSLVTFD